MTPQEAIERLNVLKEMIMDGVTENSDVYEESIKDRDSIDIAIYALKNLLPKPIELKKSVNLLKGKYYACPSCGHFFRYQYDYEKECCPEYCEECGQALDWSGER